MFSYLVAFGLLELIVIAMVWLVNRKMNTLNERLTVFFKSMASPNWSVQFITDRFDRIDHDLQQIKTRLTWSKRREKTDLKFETGGAKVHKKK